MKYQFAQAQNNFSDFASGKVFYSLPGHPAFPVRLASEIFQRCLALRKANYKNTTPCVLYDPCCGAAYHFSVLAYLHGESIREVIGSDVDEKAVSLAKRNFELLSVEGLEKRISEISEMLQQYGKDSHREALASSQILKNRIYELTQARQFETSAFRANATDGKSLLEKFKSKSVDVVFTDIPYGQHSKWQGIDLKESSNPIWSMLDALLGILSPSSVVAVVSEKRQKVSHESYQRIEQFQIGKRRVVILKPACNAPNPSRH